MTSVLRVLLDTNVLLSFAIGARVSDSAVQTILQWAADGRFVLMLPLEVLQEVREKLRTKRYFVDRFSAQDAEDVIAYLSSIGEVMPPLTGDIPAVTQDRKDDYLIAAAVLGEANYLVSGDGDLLALGDALAPLRIRSPRAFVEEFMADGAERDG